MSLLTAEQRRRKAELEREIAQIMDPLNVEAKARRRAARAAMVKRVGKRAKGQRQPRERDPGFLAYLRRLPCVAGMIEGGCEGPIEAAHIRMSSAKHGTRNAGMQQKPHDRHALPACHHHHQHDQHRGSEAAFYGRLGIDPFELSAALFSAYQAGQDGRAVLAQFTKEPR